MNWKSLDKIDSQLCKGIAILIIVTHNFMHLFPTPKENQFSFSDSYFELLHLLLHEPENIIRIFLSFFGHFGVQIFIFLSAYGVTKKYAFNNLIYWNFIFERILRIYPTFILAILAWAVISGWLYPGYGLLGPLKIVYWSLESLILKLTLLSNFFPGQSLALVGPWWFISFIFQFYFIFPFLLKLYSKWGRLILLIISVISILFSLIVQGKIGDLNIYFTILGHIPELCLGIYVARTDDAGLRIPTTLIYMAFITFFLGCIYEIFWYANHISFLIISLVAVKYLIPKIKGHTKFNELLLFFGAISMPLFLVNGFLREPFISWAIDYNHWLLTIVLCLLSLMISVLVANVLLKIEKIFNDES